MATQVSGVYIGISADTKKFVQGLKVAEGELKKFSNKMRRIVVAGAVKGDPFSETKKYVGEAGRTLNTMFKRWAEYVGEFDEGFNRSAIKTKRSVDKIIKAFIPLEQKMMGLVGGGKEGGYASFKKLSLRNQEYVKILEPYKKVSAGVKREINKFNEAIVSGNIRTEAKFQIGLHNIARLIKLEKKKIFKEYEELQFKFKKGFQIQKGATLGTTLAPLRRQLGARPAEADKIRKQIIEEILKAQKKGYVLTKEERELKLKLMKIERRINIEKKKGKHLTEGEIKAGIKIARTKHLVAEAEKKRLAVQKKLQASTFKVVQARTSNLRILKLLERGGLNELKVQSLKKTLLQNITNLKRAGISLTTKELKYDKIRTKELAKQQETMKSTGFLSKAWFKQRAGWFIQLRAFWGIYRAAAEAFETVKKFEEELKNLQAVTRATGAELGSMKDVTIEVGRTMAVQLTSIASGMVKLGQAGLTVEETSGAIKEVATLSVATMTDMTTASDLVTTAMRAWGEETDDITHVVDVLANTVNMSKVTIDKLSTALQYVTGVAPQVGLSFQETAGIIGTLANQGIKLSKVGTGLRSLLGELLRPSSRFKEELYKVGLTLRDINVKTRGFTTVLEDLKQSGFDATSAFKGLDRRAASAIAALIGRGDELRGFVESLGEVGVASEMAATQMESLSNKITITTNKTAILASKIYDVYKPMLKLGVDAIGNLADSLSNLNSVFSTLAQFFVTGGMVAGLTILTHMIYKYIAGVLAATTATGFFAGAIVGLRAAFLSLWGPLGIITVAITALTLFVGYLARSRYELSKLAEEAKKARKKYIDLNSEYKEFIDLSKKYIKALDDGNDAQADRLSQMDDELERLHSLGLSKDDEIARINEIAEAKRVAAEDELKTARRSEAYFAGARAKKALQQMKEPSIQYGVEAPLPQARTREQQDLARKQGLDEARSALALMKSQATAIIKENKDIEHSVEGIVDKLKEWWAGYDDVQELVKKVGLPPFEKWVKSAITEQKTLNTEAVEWQETMKKVEAILQSRDYTDADLIKVLDTLLDKNKELADVFKEYPKYGVAFRKLFKEEPEKAMKMVKKLSTGLSESVETSMTKVKQILIDANVFDALKKDGEDFEKIIAKLTRSLVRAQLRAKLEGVFEIGADKKTEARIKALREEVEQIGKERIGVEKKIESWKKKVNKELDKEVGKTKRALELENLRALGVKRIREEYSKTIEERIKGIKEEIRQLQEVDEFAEKRIKLTEEYRKELDKAEKEIGVMPEERQTKAQKENIRLLKIYIKLLKEKLGLEETDIDKSEEIAKIKLKTEADLVALNKKRALLEIEDPTNKKALLDLEMQISLRKTEQLVATRKLEDRASEQLKLTEDINAQEIIRLGLIEKQKREASILYDFMGRMKDKMVSFHDVMAQSLEQFATGMATGFGGMLTDFTGGFQEQRQEIAELEDELDELNIAYQEALSEGNMERAKEIKNEMAGLKNNIEDLEDPIHNLGESFKSFFKELIDNIRKAINEWLAMQAVMGILKWAGVGATSAIGAPPSGIPMTGGSIAAGTGGVIPGIESFQSFSRGGLTGSPTMAILGDNKSGKELVIPEENIQKDSVSGYTRDREDQPINIINVLDKGDLAQALLGAEGERMVVNHISKDLASRGPIARQLRV